MKKPQVRDTTAQLQACGKPIGDASLAKGDSSHTQ